MGLNLEHKDGDTLLSFEELDKIIPKYITNRSQIDELEQDNIEDYNEPIKVDIKKNKKVLLNKLI